MGGVPFRPGTGEADDVRGTGDEEVFRGILAGTSSTTVGGGMMSITFRFLVDLAAAREVRRCSRSNSWTCRVGLIGSMLVDNVGSKAFPQFGHATSPFLLPTIGLASSGESSFGRIFAVTPLVSVGTTARTEASEKTQPHGRRAMKGTDPDISLSDNGQTKGVRASRSSVVDDDGGV